MRAKKELVMSVSRSAPSSPSRPRRSERGVKPERSAMTTVPSISSHQGTLRPGWAESARRRQPGR